MIKNPFRAMLYVLIILSDSNALNFWKWDCESVSSASTTISGFSGGSGLVAKDPHSGYYCLEHLALGKDNGNQQAGAKVKGYSLGSLLDGTWIYYRFWMKIDSKFKFGNGRALIKASRIKITNESHAPPWTGFISKKHIHISECPGCIPAKYWNRGGPKIYFDFQSLAGKGWHEYIVAIKKQSGLHNSDGEIHLYFDGNEIGKGIKNLYWTNRKESCTDAWVNWMVRPYFQLNGSKFDGGYIWIDDISTDDCWNSTIK